MQVEEVPPPGVPPKGALVRVHYSLISSGTESGFVSSGGTASFVMKKARDPLNIEKVKRKIASVGLKGTLDAVRGKLFEFQAPGYSSAGTIVECGEGLYGFRVGDRVACSGVGYASHSSFNAVPQQLLTPIPDGVDFEEAAFVTLGAIAMQGVRQLFPTFGETFIVMGMGLLGQLAAQIVRAAGCRTICSDPIASKRTLAEELGAEVACSPAELDGVVDEWTGGYGADGVLVCAAAKGSEVANSALDLCRQKGRVSIVGAVGMNLARDSMYLKELDFRLSCSYGPGRYDPNYEEKGLDYPIGYVRWTEGRNMGEFLRMVAEKKVCVTPLISIRKPVAQAQEAYDAILKTEGGAISALISYDAPEDGGGTVERNLVLKAPAPTQGEIGVAVIGAGGFASAFHLPNLQRMTGARLVAVADIVGSKAKHAAEKHGAEYCTGDYREVLSDDKVDAVVIATRHNLHKPLAVAAAEAGKHIFVEKPLAITVADCEEVCDAVEKAGVLLSVGFNRRFSKFSQQAKRALDKVGGPKMILYRANAGALPADHWTVDPDEGGGRIVGEGVHFFDLCCWFLDQDPVDIRADRIDAATLSINAADNVSASLRFPDGSLATVIYCCLGHPSVSKEYIELFGGGTSIVIDDYRSIRFGGIDEKGSKQAAEHKGQYELLENWVNAIRGEADLSVTARDGLRATRIAQTVLDRCRAPELPESPDSPGS